MVKENSVPLVYKKISGKIFPQDLQALASIQGQTAGEPEKGIWKKQVSRGTNFLLAFAQNKQGEQFLATGFVPYKIDKKAKAMYIGRSIVRADLAATNVSQKMNAHLAGIARRQGILPITPGQSIAKYLSVERKIRERKRINQKPNTRKTPIKRR